MVNRGEEKVRVHMNVVPRSTMNTPMKDPLGVSPSKGNQGTTRSKEKILFDLDGNRTHDHWFHKAL